MRISDWSSDVCSSDLLAAEQTKARVDILAINAQETVDDTRIVHRPAPSKNRRRSASHAAAHPASGALMPRQRPRAAVRIGVSGAPTAEATETGDAGELLSVAAITAVIRPDRKSTRLNSSH